MTVMGLLLEVMALMMLGVTAGGDALVVLRLLQEKRLWWC